MEKLFTDIDPHYLCFYCYRWPTLEQRIQSNKFSISHEQDRRLRKYLWGKFSALKTSWKQWQIENTCQKKRSSKTPSSLHGDVTVELIQFEQFLHSTFFPEIINFIDFSSQTPLKGNGIKPMHLQCNWKDLKSDQLTKNPWGSVINSVPDLTFQLNNVNACISLRAKFIKHFCHIAQSGWSGQQICNQAAL